jgi:hypothetical protein
MEPGDFAAFPSTEECLAVGLSEREYFAVRIMQGILAHHGCGYELYPLAHTSSPDYHAEDQTEKRQFLAAHRLAHETTLARKAVSLADALLAALAEETAEKGDAR